MKRNIMKTPPRYASVLTATLLAFVPATTALSMLRQDRSLQENSTEHQHSETTTTTTTTTTTSENSQRYQVLNDTSIRTAVHDWVTQTNKEDVIATYGPISEWNTERVTDMSELFMHARFFNDDLSRWNTSSVTDMSYIFAFCSSFRGVAGYLDDDDETTTTNTNANNPDAYSLRHWDTSRLRDLKFAFHQATAFEGDGIVDWDVSQVTDLSYFMQGALNFHHTIWRWDTRNVRSFNRAFHNATRFSQALCWQLHPHAMAVQTFCGTNGAQFACDPNHVLQSQINVEYHNCCSCDYSANQHYYGYHLDDDEFWNINTNDAADSNDHDVLGITLASCIWGLVIVMIGLVVVVTLRRRREVGEWIQSKLNTTSSSNNNHRGVDHHLAPDGGVIATLVGPAESATTVSTSTRADSPEMPAMRQSEEDDSIPMVIGADHVQWENSIVPATNEFVYSQDAASFLASVLSPSEEANQSVPFATGTVPSTLNWWEDGYNSEAIDLPTAALDILDPAPRNTEQTQRQPAHDEFVC